MQADVAARLFLAARERRGVRLNGARWALDPNALAEQLAELDAAVDEDTGYVVVSDADEQRPNQDLILKTATSDH